MSIEQNKSIMWRMIHELWNQGDLSVADELFTADHTSPSAPDLPPGPEAVKMLVKMFRDSMPDYNMVIEFMVADEEQVVGRFVQTGTHTGAPLMTIPASGRSATWTEIGVLKIKDGKIVMSWYEPDMMSLMGQLTQPSPREIIDKYYETANAGNWDAWCDLFADNMVMDEQLAGHIETLATLRPMMGGMKTFYSKFQNVPINIVVSGNEGAVRSHISAANAAGEPIESDAMNYFRFENGKIAYMSNHHDSKPFEPFLKQLK